MADNSLTQEIADNCQVPMTIDHEVLPSGSFFLTSMRAKKYITASNESNYIH